MRRRVIPVRIAGTSSSAPGTALTTAEMTARVDPPRDAAETERRTGIALRHFADPRDSAAEIAARSLTDALSDAGLEAVDLERIIFVTSVSQDLMFPATANLVAAALGLRGSCDCFDLNNACMGFLSALDVSARAIATGFGPIGIVVIELPSRYIAPEDPRPYLVFGDGVASAVLTAAENGEGILAAALRNDGIAFGNVRLEHPGLTHRRETIRFTASNSTMGAEAIDAIRWSVDAVLEQSGLRLDDVQWVLPHQPNGALLQAITEALGVAPERVVPIVREFGSVGAASIPISLDRLRRSGRIRPGDRLLMVGVGAGLSYGAVLFQEKE